jgi:hypothetical protein
MTYEEITFPIQLMKSRRLVGRWINKEDIPCINDARFQPFDKGDCVLLFKHGRPRLARYSHTEVNSSMASALNGGTYKEIEHMFNTAAADGYWSTSVISGLVREVDEFHKIYPEAIRIVSQKFKTEELQVMARIGIKLPN